MNASPAAPPAEPEGMPSQGVRTFITFLLFLHLFALFVAVASNFRPVSPLRMQLREVPLVTPYLQALHMDLAYNYHLTYATELDIDHYFELDLNSAGAGSKEANTTLGFPAPDLGIGLQAQRYRNLALNAAQLVENDDQDGILPKAVARRLLLEQGIDAGTHRLRLQRHLLVAREALDSPDPARSDPNSPSYFATAYEADVKLLDGELYLNKTAEIGESAPVEQEN